MRRGAAKVLLAAGAVAMLVSLHAQEPPRLGERPEFEVAIIRPNPSTESPRITQQVVVQGAIRIQATHVTARELIRYAYEYQYRPVSLVTGGPGWLDSERWDLTAQAEERFQPIPRPGMLPPEAAAMLRTLLEDRMQLRVRREERERSAYALILERSDGALGAGLTESEGTCLGSVSPREPDSELFHCPYILGPHPSGQGARLELGNITMEELASVLGTFPAIDELVVDQTGLTGRYDIKVHFQGSMAISANAPPVARPVEATEVPPLAAAIRQQLGLRLERRRMPVEFIVIEHVERPSEN